MTAPTPATPPPSPSANDTGVVPRLSRAAVLVAVGWCWATWGLDWLAGMAALGAVLAPLALAARELWRTRNGAGRC